MGEQTTAPPRWLCTWALRRGLRYSHRERRWQLATWGVARLASSATGGRSGCRWRYLMLG